MNNPGYKFRKSTRGTRQGAGMGMGRGSMMGQGLCPFGEQCPNCPMGQECPYLNAELRDHIMNFFIENPNPSDKKVHSFAKKLGINKHKFEEEIYSLLTDLLNE